MLDNPTLIDLEPLTTHKARAREHRVHLSPRERQIMQYKASGMTTQHIASRLNMSISTVRLRIAEVHRKLQAPSTENAVAKCVALKLIKITME